VIAANLQFTLPGQVSNPQGFFVYFQKTTNEDMLGFRQWGPFEKKCIKSAWQVSRNELVGKHAADLFFYFLLRSAVRFSQLQSVIIQLRVSFYDSKGEMLSVNFYIEK
jgi:hypothetical protein